MKAKDEAKKELNPLVLIALGGFTAYSSYISYQAFATGRAFVPGGRRGQGFFVTRIADPDRYWWATWFWFGLAAFLVLIFLLSLYVFVQQERGYWRSRRSKHSAPPTDAPT